MLIRKTCAYVPCSSEFEVDGSALFGRRRKYCGPTCAYLALVGQSKALAERRKKEKQETDCGICGKRFLKPNRQALYCCEDCKKEGLNRAIERQRQRRAEAKLAKLTSAPRKDASRRTEAITNDSIPCE